MAGISEPSRADVSFSRRAADAVGNGESRNEHFPTAAGSTIDDYLVV